LPGVIAPQVRPLGPVSVRVIALAKPFSAVMVMVDVDEAPAFTAGGDGAAIVKSTNLKVAVTECEIDPLLPLIVSV